MADEFDVGAIHFLDEIAGHFVGVVDLDLLGDADDGADVFGDEADVVGDGDDGGLAADFVEVLMELDFGGKIEVGGGFVEEEELRLSGEGAGDEDTLALAAGEGGEAAVFEVVEVHLFEGILGKFAVWGAKRSEGAGLTESAHEDDVGNVDGEIGVHLAVLGDVSDLGAGVFGSSVEYGNGAFLGAEEAEDKFEHGGFAGAVGADDADEIAFGEFQVDIVEDGVIVVGEGDVFEGDDGLIIWFFGFSHFFWLSV